MLTASGVTGEPQDAVFDAVRTGGWPALADGPGTLPEPDRALLGYVTKLTLTPGRMERADVEALRRVGFDDRSIPTRARSRPTTPS